MQGLKTLTDVSNLSKVLFRTRSGGTWAALPAKGPQIELVMDIAVYRCLCIAAEPRQFATSIHTAPCSFTYMSTHIFTEA